MVNITLVPILVVVIISIVFIAIYCGIYWIALSIKYKRRWKWLEPQIRQNFRDANPISPQEKEWWKNHFKFVNQYLKENSK